jgi:hypothetical protein
MYVVKEANPPRKLVLLSAMQPRAPIRAYLTFFLARPKVPCVKERNIGQSALKQPDAERPMTKHFDFGELQLSNMKVFETRQSRGERKEKLFSFSFPTRGDGSLCTLVGEGD